MDQKNEPNFWPDFWKERWQKNETGFHQDEINPLLKTWWEKLQINSTAHIFVPLCGKTHDMLWLLEQGYEVLGVEISPIAVEDFFTENKLEPQITEQGSFKQYSYKNLTILCGDFFALTKNDLENIGAVYDRASLIALPPELRQQYVDHLSDVLPKAAQTLLVTLSYLETEMDGPPFSVTEQEVNNLFSDQFQIEKLASQEILPENDQFKKRGLTSLVETVYRFSRS